MPRFILTGYIEEAMASAEYEKLEDGTYAGRIPDCLGVAAFGETLSQCEKELNSVLEDWILVGLRMGHPLPVIHDFDLNRTSGHEPMAAV